VSIGSCDGAETQLVTGPRGPDPVTAGLQRLLEDITPETHGALADYIPELARAEPERFGIALVSMDGHAYGVGDCDVPFTIQSVSKPFVYALALADLGAEDVLARVGGWRSTRRSTPPSWRPRAATARSRT
jgi:glutaminase